MICELKIKREDSIWECNTCYSILHLKCIEEWIKQKNPSFNFNENKNNKKKDGNNEKEKFSYTCPHCNAQYQDTKLPKYNCYCKKYYEAVEQNHRDLNIELIPHGCGLYCNEKICPHIDKCPLPCHPGPHVTCKEQIKVFCFCKKTSKILPCSFEASKSYSCGQICGKQLFCGKKNHTCKAVCHTDECEKFLKNRKCYECVAESRDKLFDFLKNTLEKKLNEECYEAQHLTHFASCLTAYIFKGELPCHEHTVPVKTDTCLKLLLRIFEISGEKLLENLKMFIPICEKKVENCCSCKNKKQEGICYKINYPEDILDFLGVVKEEPIEKCNKVCKTLKNCGIHKCERVCCELRNVKIRNYSIQDPLGYHLCFKICGKQLKCGKHNCENYCHKGSCKPCAYIIHEGDLVCECGKTVKKPPYICGTIIECTYPCSKKRNCGHSCPLKCHQGDCPPCEVIIDKKCRCGKKIISNLKCGDTKPVLCTSICNSMLPCGVHFCQIKCHDHTDEYDNQYKCDLTCQRQYTLCEHYCKDKCHGESECNEFNCNEMNYLTCKCKILKKQMKCGELKKLKDDYLKDPKNINKEEYFLPCGEECIKNQRLKDINEAFQGLKNLSDSKLKMLYPNCSLDGSEDVKKENVTKYHNETIKLFTENFDKYFGYEKEVYKILQKSKDYKIKAQKEEKNENDKKEEIKEKTYRIAIEEDDFEDLNEWLVLYHNVKPKKIYVVDKKELTRKYYMQFTQNQLEKFHYQKYRLSLICLLLMHNLFVTNKKYIVYHPFKYSLEIRNLKSNKLYENVENSLMSIGKLKIGDFYLYEFDYNKFYLHFFDENQGKEIFNIIKKKLLEFNEVYEIYYDKNQEFPESYFYKYLRNEDYLNYLKNGYDLKYTSNKDNIKPKKINSEDSDEEDEDEDGFTVVKNKKNKK